jgi:hypothetical protein
VRLAVLPSYCKHDSQSGIYCRYAQMLTKVKVLATEKDKKLDSEQAELIGLYTVFVFQKAETLAKSAESAPVAEGAGGVEFKIEAKGRRARFVIATARGDNEKRPAASDGAWSSSSKPKHA